MRKLVAGIFISVDGVVSSPEEWRLPFDAETAEFVAASTKESDAILLGRRTYLEFADYWSGMGSEVPMADYLNNTPKYVVSDTLDDLKWDNSTLINGEIIEQLVQLKQQPGKNIQIPGSPKLVWSLLRSGLLDELNLMVQPVVAGSGDRLPEIDQRVNLELVDLTRLGNGVLCVRYRPADD